MKRIWRNYGLSITLFGLFLISEIGLPSQDTGAITMSRGSTASPK